MCLPPVFETSTLLSDDWDLDFAVSTIPSDGWELIFAVSEILSLGWTKRGKKCKREQNEAESKTRAKKVLTTGDRWLGDGVTDLRGINEGYGVIRRIRGGYLLRTWSVPHDFSVFLDDLTFLPFFFGTVAAVVL